MPPRFVARQLAHPTGLLGRIMGHLMNRHNARMNAFVVEQLAIEPADRVLEVGFGGGVNLPALVSRAAFVMGLDRSETMIAAARARYAAAVQARRADFQQGTVEALPLAAGSFDKACTVNTVYFWPSLDAGFAELARVLRPGGRAVVGFLPKEHMDRMGMPADVFTPRRPEDVVAAMQRVGFTDVHVTRPRPTTPWNAVVAVR
jgi:ubiquinone/menaquinone biosynthesis C-methylase UbiE